MPTVKLKSVAGLRLFTNDQGCKLIRGHDCEVYYRVSTNNVWYVVNDTLYIKIPNALHAIELYPSKLTTLDAGWRKLDTLYIPLHVYETIKRIKF
ncbi:MAG: hypothetical protein CMP20_10345 [Rickettsiales bacterium]|nr:hypothetical protein [Rickettsiales bacterium]